jgi:hypothetical protein
MVALLQSVALGEDVPIGPETAREVGIAISLVTTRDDAVTLIRYFRSGINFYADPDIQWRRENNYSNYCPGQVYVFASLISSSEIGDWRWVVNTRKKIVSGVRDIDDAVAGSKAPRFLGLPAMPKGSAMDPNVCLDGTKPVALPE